MSLCVRGGVCLFSHGLLMATLSLQTDRYQLASSFSSVGLCSGNSLARLCKVLGSSFCSHVNRVL